MLDEEMTAGLTDTALFKQQSHVDGAWVGTPELAVTDPASGAVVGQVPAMDAAAARNAVDAAHAAFGPWSGMLPQERGEKLRRWFRLIEAAREDLARIMVREQGKPLQEARGEIDYGASFVEFYAEEARRPNIEGITSHLPDAEVELWREPVGVAALITPWNFPNAMITRKAAAALAIGCPVVVHPSSETPFSALALAELAQRAGLPAGVFNVVTGAAQTIVSEWTADARVRALSFTGSTRVGRLLYEQSAANIKRLVMELGGHAPVIVFADANLDQAVEEAMKAKYATSGQDCLAANRIYVEDPIYDEFCDRFARASEALRIGSGMDEPDIGPLMNAGAMAKQAEHIEDALSHGARLMCGGPRPDLGPLFHAPTVLADVPDAARIMTEETFGPVAPITRFTSEDEVVTRANALEYGLVAYLHTQNPRRIYRMARSLDFGMVAINRTKITGAPIPFGGMKQSGIGREGARQGMEAFSEIKYVCRDWR